ncbi:4'-phosphopantetheinyl transferase family protein [Streptomyces sp. NPDC002536]
MVTAPTVVGAGPVEVAPGVFVAVGRAGRTSARPHPVDAADAEAFGARRAREFLTGRALLRSVLCAVVPRAQEDAVVKAPGGRPLLAGHRDIGVSVSHDADLVAAAVAPGRAVGVDVQHPQGAPSPRMLRRCLHEHAASVARLSGDRQAEELAWAWAVQEACVKAEGSGLAGLPWRIDVPPARSAGRWRQFTWLRLDTLSTTPLACAFSDRGPLTPPHGPVGAPTARGVS